MMKDDWGDVVYAYGERVAGGRVKTGRRDIRFETEYYFCFTNSVRSLNAINNLRNYGDYIKRHRNARYDGR